MTNATMHQALAVAITIALMLGVALWVYVQRLDQARRDNRRLRADIDALRKALGERAEPGVNAPMEETYQ